MLHLSPLGLAAYMFLHKFAGSICIAGGDGFNNRSSFLVCFFQRFAAWYVHGVAVEKKELGHAEIFCCALRFKSGMGKLIDLLMKVSNQVDECLVDCFAFLGSVKLDLLLQEAKHAETFFVMPFCSHCGKGSFYSPKDEEKILDLGGCRGNDFAADLRGNDQIAFRPKIIHGCHNRCTAGAEFLDKIIGQYLVAKAIKSPNQAFFYFFADGACLS